MHLVLSSPLFKQFVFQFIIDGSLCIFCYNFITFLYFLQIFLMGRYSILIKLSVLSVFSKHLFWLNPHLLEFFLLFGSCLFLFFSFSLLLSLSLFDENLFGLIFPDRRLANLFILQSDAKLNHIIISELITNFQYFVRFSLAVLSDLISEKSDGVDKFFLNRTCLLIFLIKNSHSFKRMY